MCKGSKKKLRQRQASRFCNKRYSTFKHLPTKRPAAAAAAKKKRKIPITFI
jgi:hypothetical protein